MDIQLRRLRGDEIQTLLELRCRFIREIRGREPSAQFRADTTAYLECHRSDDAFVCWVAEANGDIVATVMLAVQEHPPGADHPNTKAGHLFNVHTLPEYRRRGIAARLLTACIEAAKAEGVPEFRLQAEPEAVSLYKRLGFVPADRDMILYAPE